MRATAALIVMLASPAMAQSPSARSVVAADLDKALTACFVEKAKLVDDAVSEARSIALAVVARCRAPAYAMLSARQDQDVETAFAVARAELVDRATGDVVEARAAKRLSDEIMAIFNQAGKPRRP